MDRTLTRWNTCPRKLLDADYIGEPASLAGYTEVSGIVRLRETAAVDLQGMECLERVQHSRTWPRRRAVKSTHRARSRAWTM